ncbi:MAG: DinB family protein [Planctomycetota bacterium]
MADAVSTAATADLLLPQLAMSVSYLRGLVADIGEDEFATQPAGADVNTPWWVVGHVTLTLGGSVKICGGESPVPKSYGPLFGGGSAAVPADPDAAPGKADLMAVFDAAVDELTRVLPHADPERLAAARDTSFAPELPRQVDMLAFLIGPHFGIHAGQLTVWRRLTGRPPRF